MLKQKLLHQEQGFTLVEVLVAILIATLFVSAAMQTMVIAAIFKAKAQEYAEATTWIQEDLENIRYQAANFQYTSLSANANSGDSLINVTSVNDLAASDNLKVGTDSGTYTIATGGITGNSLTITSSLGTTQSQGAVVVGITRCNSGLDTGFADGLRDKIIGSNQTETTTSVDVSKTSNLTGKTFTLSRTATVSRISNTAPYSVLQVSYKVLPTSGGSSVANFYTEVIPNAALQCPK